MLKQRNVMVVSMLLSTSVQGVRLSNGAAQKKYDEETNTPPKEVSHFKQEDVKKYLDRSWWRDNALPTTPSYNDGDSEADTHPMGSTFAQ